MPSMARAVPSLGYAAYTNGVLANGQPGRGRTSVAHAGGEGSAAAAAADEVQEYPEEDRQTQAEGGMQDDALL